MRRIARLLAQLSLERACRLFLDPWRIPLELTRPRALSPSDAILSLFPDVPPAAVQACLLAFLSNNTFFSELNTLYVEKRHRRADCRDKKAFLYLAVRYARPRTIVETGVFDGISSAVVLQALSDNGGGMLISIDLPAVETINMSTDKMRETALPPGCRPGWAIPAYLREHHRLVLGDSRTILPSLLEEQPQIDVFFHDSLHSYKHQLFEYTTAWPKLCEGGLLLSDDIFWSAAFHKFCKQMKKRYVWSDNLGAVRK